MAVLAVSLISPPLSTSCFEVGIPNMLKVCSLTCSSWALVTSWGHQAGICPGTGPPGQ